MDLPGALDSSLDRVLAGMALRGASGARGASLPPKRGASETGTVHDEAEYRKVLRVVGPSGPTAIKVLNMDLLLRASSPGDIVCVGVLWGRHDPFNYVVGATAKDTLINRGVEEVKAQRAHARAEEAGEDVRRGDGGELPR